MKKTLTALAVLGAFAGSAMAADVTIYGVIDTGLQYQDTSYDGIDALAQNPDAADMAARYVDDSAFKMSSGVSAGSRFGIKGREDLGNGLAVSFVLENGFTSDDGALNNGGRLFGRESQVSFHTPYGTLAMGRMGNLVSGNGTYGLAGNLSPFGTSWGDYSASVNNVMTTFDRYDNTVTYKSPEFAGVTVYAQYSFGTDAKNTYDGVEGKSSIDRYAAIGATYANGPLNLVAIVDQTNYSTTRFDAVNPNPDRDVDDALSFTLGGSYDFQVAKVYAGAQYFKDADINSVDRVSSSDFSLTPGDNFQMKGFGLALGADIPLGGGTFKVGTAYLDGTIEQVNKWDMADTEYGEFDLTRWNTSVGYQYNLSKRTSLYSVASYSYNNTEASKAVNNVTIDIDKNVVEAAVGLVHKF